MTTTAEIRNRAYEARRAGDFALAAELYDQALAAYPKQNGSQLAEMDKLNLAKYAAQCRSMAAIQ